jgi:membrane protein
MSVLPDSFLCGPPFNTMHANPLISNEPRLVPFLKRVAWEIRADDVLGRAAQLAYYFFLALFPFIICIIASLSVFGFADRGRTLLLAVSSYLVPAPAFQLIGTTIDQIIQASGPFKMSLGIAASLWAASMGMGAVMSTLNAAYKVEESRSLFTQYVVAIALTAGVASILITSVVVEVFGDDVIGALSSGNLPLQIWSIAKWPLGLATLAITFEVIYYFAPDVRERDWHWITPGTVVGIFFLAVVSIGSRIYLYYASSYGAAYGSLGAVIVLLLWFYLSGIALLAGGVVNAVLENPSTPISTRH